MTKDHFVPRLIIKNFADSNENIYFLNKTKKEISSLVPYHNQLQKSNFYSEKSLLELKGIFQHISINPIFTRIELNLEKNLDLCLEFKLGVILSKIVKPLLNKNKVNILKEDKEFIKEYISIQHLRTIKFKEIAKEMHNQTLRFPQNIKEIIMNIENNRTIDFKKIVKEKFPDLNSKARRLKVNELKKRLSKDPGLIERVRKDEKTKDIINNEIKRAEEKLEKIRLHPDKHSSEIIDLKLRNSFFKSCNFQNKCLKFIINDTRIPFVLTDTGLVIMCWDDKIKKELHIYLPIHPNILIEFSEDSKEREFVSEEFVKEFNRISLDESLLNIYSSSIESLKLIISDGIQKKLGVWNDKVY